MSTETKPRRNTEILTCCCCGNPERGRQHWNLYDGYGICTPCVTGVQASGRLSAAEIQSYYGARGYNYALTGDDM